MPSFRIAIRSRQFKSLIPAMPVVGLTPYEQHNLRMPEPLPLAQSQASNVVPRRTLLETASQSLLQRIPMPINMCP